VSYDELVLIVTLPLRSNVLVVEDDPCAELASWTAVVIDTEPLELSLAVVIPAALVVVELVEPEIEDDAFNADEAVTSAVLVMLKLVISVVVTKFVLEAVVFDPSVEV